ncbi:MAG: thioesterase family protein [Acutalibacteraceae bacterium]
MEIIIGAENIVKTTVTNEKTAKSAESGTLDVFATPFMCALMEKAASELCEKYIQEGFTTVGTSLEIKHLAATAVGQEVFAKAVVTEFDGRKISFDVEAFDNAGLIGQGKHERFVVQKEKFMQKAEKRSSLSKKGEENV